MNNKQKESLAKFCYEVGKLSFGGLVLVTIMSNQSYLILLGGLALTAVLVILALWLERDKGGES